jgi:hypothetical protein
MTLIEMLQRYEKTVPDSQVKELLGQAAERIAELDVQSQWVSVEDRLPEIADSVVLFHPDWALEVSRFRRGAEYPLHIGLCEDSATHWMPLTLPSAKEQGS